MMGGQNCHAEVIFEDGLVWILRAKLSNVNSPPCEVRDYVIQSEAATMRFLQDFTNIPSPRIFDWAAESDPSNTVGIGYILMEKMPGSPLDWQQATASQRAKVVRQLADVMLEVERHPFGSLGSLVASARNESDKEALSPYLSMPQVNWLAQHHTFRSGEDSRPLGPFCSSSTALRSLVNAYLELIASGEIGTVANGVDVFLAHRFRLNVLDSSKDLATKTAETQEKREEFVLKHPDDKGDHIFVNEDFDIVGIIDWEWCSTTSKAEAFSSPCMMWPVADFYDGSNELAHEELLLAGVFREKGRDDLAGYVLNGRRVQRLFFALGPSGAAEDKKTFARLFMGMKRAVEKSCDDDKVKRSGNEEEEWLAWKAEALEKWKDEPLLQTLLANV